MWLIALATALSLGQAADQTGRIAGRVTLDGADTPIAAARVMLMPARPTGPIGPPPQTTTDVDGRYEFTGVVAGAYRITIQKAGYAALDLPMPGTAPAPTVTVVAGQTVRVDRHLQKGGVIAGRILDDKGEPLPDVSIVALRRMAVGRAGAPARLLPVGTGQTTNDLGDFRIAGLATGEYYVAAMPRPGIFGANSASSSAVRRNVPSRTFYPGTSDEAAAQPLAVTAGAEMGNIVFTMQMAPAFRVSGTVVDDDGKPAANAMVMLHGDPLTGGFGPAIGARTGADGRFELVDVTPGTYRVDANIMIAISGASSGVSGGITGGTYSSTTTASFGGTSTATRGAPTPPSIVVTDADVTGLQVVGRRPILQ